MSSAQEFTHRIDGTSMLFGDVLDSAMLAAAEAGCELFEYTPAEIKRAVVGVTPR